MSKQNKATARTVAPVIVTRDEMAITAGEIADLQNERNRLVIEKNEKIATIDKEYAKRIDDIDAQLKLKLSAGLGWCERNEATEFRDSRTANFTRADVQFRRGNWTVNFKSGWNSEKVIAALKSFLQPGKPVGSKYVRTVEEVNKDAIREDRKLMTDVEWAALGVRISQEKSMIVTPHADETQNKQTIQEAA